ncbi:MAG: 8-amino-7-oxononanoate synthase [Chloroflexi bacterium]|nr:8-amino-7-oxononanoate synthase [Chloroflexota bacterium]
MASGARFGLPPAWADSLAAELREIERLSLTRTIVTPESGPEARVALGGRRCLHFTSNNYLGLSTDPRLIKAANAATLRYGAGAASSRLLCGSTPLHHELEARLAKLKGMQAALLYSSGYLANVGLISALAGPGDTIFSDSLNHASIIDGTRLSRAETVIYRHCDPSDLERLLRKSRAKRKLIYTESVFSMDGDIAPLPDILTLAKRYGALLVIDEAHATGILGRDGAGALSHSGITGGPIAVMGTLSKALGSAGGFVAGDATLISFLINRSRTFIFNTALPAGSVGAALAALDIVAKEPWRRTTGLALAQRLREGFRDLGYPETPSQTQIVPLVIGAADAAVAMERRLRKRGILAKAVRPPTVPKGTSRIRFNLMATHTEQDVDAVLKALGKSRRG